MAYLCCVCERFITCDKFLKLGCDDCLNGMWEQQTGQICPEKFKDEDPYLIICPICQTKILLNNAKYGGLRG